MVAPVPAEISKLRARSTRSSAPPPTHNSLRTAHPPLRPLCSLLCVLCVALFSVLGTQARQLSCLHRFAASLSSLCALFCTRFLYFQHLAASFHKMPECGIRRSTWRTPGWGVPRFPFQSPTAHYPRLTTHSPLTTFRMNTCKSVSKQNTLTIFRMNTYAKQGEGGYLFRGP